MPSRKSVAQRASGKSQMCKQAQVSVSGLSPVSRKVGSEDKLDQVSAKNTVQSALLTSSAGTTNDMQVRSRTPSEQSPKSVSTNEGSCSSDCGSDRGSPAGSEGFPAFSNEAASSQEGTGVSVSTGLICAPNAPIWVDNGMKGEQTAWLLVLPKVQPSLASLATKYLPRSPNDTVLLGPYVTTKNTFLEEDFPMAAVPSQRARAQSCGAGSRF